MLVITPARRKQAGEKSREKQRKRKGFREIEALQNAYSAFRSARQNHAEFRTATQWL